jgi:hypothetical protein
MGTRLRLAAALVAAGALAPACTQGTTPDCSDAQCLIPSALSDATEESDAPAEAEAAADAGAGDAADATDTDRDAADAHIMDATDDSARDAGHPSDAAAGG